MLRKPKGNVAAVFVASLLWLPYTPTLAQEAPPQATPPAQQEEPDPRDFGYGLGSILASLLYSPLKVTYAGLGLITGGLGFVLSGGRKDVINNIVYPALQGDYVVTPYHLKGEKPLIFIGPPPPDETRPEPLFSDSQRAG